MDVLYWIIGILWIIGAISEIAKMNAKIYKSNIEEPYSGAFLVVTIMIFFTWPYWYFYGKHA